VAKSGYLVMIDISRYTTFLTQVNLEEGESLLRILVETMMESVESPLQIAKLEGDAIFAYAPDGSFLQGQTLLEALEHVYIAFRSRQRQMLLNKECSVQAYEKLPILDIKMAIHYGEYLISTVGGSEELCGPDVILAHRLLKNSITSRTGVQAYAYITDSAAQAMQIGDLASNMQWHTESYEDLGNISGYVHPLMPAWEKAQQVERNYVTSDDAWFDMETMLDVSPALAWDFLNEPEAKRLWTQADELTVKGMENGRLDVGVEQYCRHGDNVNVHRIVEWQPLHYVTYDIQAPFNLMIRYTIELLETPQGTWIIWRFAHPATDNPFHKVVTNIMSPFIRGFLKNSVQLASAIIRERAAHY